MVSVRKQRRGPSQSPPSGPPSNHDCSDKKADIQVGAENKRRNHSEDQGRDLELEENLNVTGESRDPLMTGIEASSVPATKAGAMESTDVDCALSKCALAIPTTRITMSLILEHAYMKRPRVDLQLKQDLEPDLEPDIEQLELQRTTASLNRAPESVMPGGDMDLPSVQLQPAAAGLNPALDFVIPAGGDCKEFSAVQLNRSWSDNDLSDEENHRPGVAVRKKKVSKIMSRCLVVDREMTHAERMKYIFGPSVASKNHLQAEAQGPRRIRPAGAGRIDPKCVVQAEVASPLRALLLKRHHFIQSSRTFNNILDEDLDEDQDEDHQLR